MRGGRPVSAVARAGLICFLLALAVAAGLPASALAAGGTVSGTVTDSSTHAALASVAVVAFDTNRNYVANAFTDSHGGYAIGGLQPGSYEIDFSASDGHIGQYYDGKPSLTAADAVAVAGGAATTNINAALAPGGQIAGTATDAVTHTPVGNVTATVYDAHGDYAGSAATGSNGRYSVSGLATGTYRVQFIPSPDSPYGPQYYSGQATLSHAAGVSVVGGQTTGSIDSQLAAAARITGTVTDAGSHTGIGSVAVTAYDGDGTEVASTYTSADGSYSLGGLAAGPYRLLFAPDGSVNYASLYSGGASSLAAATPVNTTAGQAATANAALTEGATISGTVTDAQTGKPVAGVNVTVIDAAGDYVAGGYSGDDGTYTVKGLLPGTYTVGFFPYDNLHAALYYSGKSAPANADPVTVGASGAAGVNAALTRGASITGTVTDAASGRPAPGMAVLVYDSNGDQIGYAASADDGTYTVGGLSAGSYRVGFQTEYRTNAYASQYYNAVATLSAAQTLSLSAGQTVSGVDAAMRGGGSVDGTVTSATSGSPLPAIGVELFATGAGYPVFTHTDASGRYFVGGLPAGTYTASFFDSASAYLGRAYGSGGTAGQFTVSDGATTHGIDAALTPAGAISGTVTDAASHAPIAGVSVRVASQNGGSGSATTAADGTYSVKGLPPGAYTVTFSELGSANYLTHTYGAGPVMVAAGATVTDIDAALIPGGAISGRVTDAQSSAGVSGASGHRLRLGRRLRRGDHCGR